MKTCISSAEEAEMGGLLGLLASLPRQIAALQIQRETISGRANEEDMQCELLVSILRQTGMYIGIQGCTHNNKHKSQSSPSSSSGFQAWFGRTPKAAYHTFWWWGDKITRRQGIIIQVLTKVSSPGHGRKERQQLHTIPSDCGSSQPSATYDPTKSSSAGCLGTTVVRA